ncbi:MAG: hypothetical protein HY785_07130 [Oscillatoriophycideae cyanobacterium NC_groundwater_1537_Pr4_S-0.65um_50_18]|nr:hypothetical protein [Oscillatoriophycideae cyanobacterium NC_groundwater_1537_Pr4_S-0.65um_50_18]
MNTSSFIIWAIFVGAIAAFAIITMSQAYVGSGSLALVFSEPIALADASEESASAASSAPATPEIALFKQGSIAFQAGNYRQAADRFATLLQRHPHVAEAYHNRGRAIANLRSDNEAASTLVKAGELYLQQDNTAGYEQVKQDLQQLKDKRIAEKALKDKA